MALYTAEQIKRAKNVDVREFLEQTEGFHFAHHGRYLKCKNPKRTGQPSSLTIDTEKNRIFYNAVTGQRPLSALDWCLKIREMDFPTAMLLILGEHPDGEHAEKPKYKPFKPCLPSERQVREFRMPEKDDKTGSVYLYLTENRGIPGHIVNYCLKHGFIFQDSHKNAVFAGFDEDGTMKYAARRGTRDDFRRDAAGSDKSFAFKLVGKNTNTIYVTEAAIDALSLAALEDLLNGKWSYRKKTYISTGGAGIDRAIEQFVKTHPVKVINICFDDDEAGKNGMEKIMEKYKAMNIEVNDMRASYAHDYNDELLAYRESPEAYQEYLSSLRVTPFDRTSVQHRYKGAEHNEEDNF